MKVYELLDSPEKWTKGSPGKNAQDIPTIVSEACKWCLWGAIYYCYNSEYFSIQQLVSRKLKHRYGLGEWNDAPERTYDEVVQLCKELDI